MLVLLLSLLAMCQGIAYTPTYGLYCGGGHSRVDKSIPGVDALDEACRVHDICYRSKGYSMCQCDAALLSALSRPLSCKSLRCQKYQNGARELFSYMPCRCPTTVLGTVLHMFRGMGGQC